MKWVDLRGRLRLGTLGEFLGHFLGTLWEIFESSLVPLWELFGSSLTAMWDIFDGYFTRFGYISSPAEEKLTRVGYFSSPAGEKVFTRFANFCYFFFIEIRFLDLSDSCML